MATGYYINVLISLLVVAGILYGVLRLSRSVQRKRYSGEIRVVDRLPVDNGVSLLIVTVRNQELLLSVGGKEVQVLKELSKDDRSLT